MNILFLEPVFQKTIWGSEDWIVSAHEGFDDSIKSGEYEGKKLSELWDEHRELFGNLEGDVFPLLTKIITANDDLSIQVHPDDEYARVHECGSLGKTECWYILDAEPGTTIVIGHHAKTRDELKNMIADKRWGELIREVPVKKGDFFYIVPGTVHAIKGGTLILETQQNSDITYRLYDYDRLQGGKLRELHIDKSIDVINVPFTEVPTNPDLEHKVSRNAWWESLLVGEFFSVWKGKLTDGVSLELVQDQKFLIATCIDGNATIEKDGDVVEVVKGTSFILPADFGTANISGSAEFIFSAPSK